MIKNIKIPTYKRGASVIANALAPNTVNITANTKVALSSSSVWTLATTNTTPSITDVTSVVEQKVGGLVTANRLVLKEFSSDIQTNNFSINVDISPNFGGNATATIIFELFSIASNSVVRSTALTLSQFTITGYTVIPHTLQFFPIADLNSFLQGYEIRVISDRSFTYSVKKIVRTTIGQ